MILSEVPQPLARDKTTKVYLVIFILLACIALVFAAYFYFFVLHNKKGGYKADFYFWDKTSSEIKKTVTEPLNVAITDIDYSKETPSSRSMGKIIKGYFHGYDNEKKTIQVKNQFMGSAYLQLLDLNTSSLKQFSCWPKEIQSEGNTFQTQTLEFFVEPDGRDILLPSGGEKLVPIDQLETFLNSDHYLIIQLREIFNFERTNNVQKLILLGC